jgi:hypothetical protein
MSSVTEPITFGLGKQGETCIPPKLLEQVLRGVRFPMDAM